MPVGPELRRRRVILKDRLFRRALLALPLISIASCEKPISEPPSTVARLVVSPNAVTLQPNQGQDFTAVGFTAAGDTAQIAVRWSTTGGTVDTGSVGGRHFGHYRQTTCGQFRIRATSQPGGLSDSASITVTCTAPVAAVSVGPASASILVGETVQLTTTLTDAYGNVLTGRMVTWASNNPAVATVSDTGLVRGIAAGGPVTLTATSEGQSGTAAITVKASGSSAQFDHVFLVVEENTDYVNVTNSSMPYLTGLAAEYGLATQYYANTHPSIGNYFQLTSGQIVTNNDSYSSTVNVDNVVRRLVAAGTTWKSYAEGLPSVGFVGLDYDDGTYASRHNTIVHFTDVHDNAAQAQDVVPFTRFATDLANGTLPNYSFIVPDLCNDAHNCSLNTADSWLQTNIDPLVRSAFCQQSNCLLIITFDESAGDNSNGGGRVYWVAVSPTKSKRGYQSATLYQHESTLRLMLNAIGVTSVPGAAATAPAMSEFFNP
jgi:uncharacterized protein YjdB